MDNSNYSDVVSTLVGSLPIPASGLVGKLVGGITGGVLNKLTGATATAAGMFAGHHSLNVANVDDSKWNVGDAQLVLAWAAATQMSVEDVCITMAADMAATGHSAQYVWDAYAANGGAGAAASLRNWRSQIASSATSFNALVNNGGTPTIVQLASVSPAASPTVTQAMPLPTSATAGTPSQLTQDVPAPTSLASNLTSDEIKTVGKGIVQGAYNGGLTEIMKTQAGKDAQQAGFKQFMNDNAALIAAGAVPVSIALTLLVKAALSRR